jgi:hypothetical protein
MHSTAVKAMMGWIVPGAASKPHKAVNTTSDITLGLVKAQKSRHSAGINMSRAAVVMSVSKRLKALKRRTAAGYLITGSVSNW